MGSVLSASARREVLNEEDDDGGFLDSNIIVQDPSGDHISNGALTPNTNASLTPQSSPILGRRISVGQFLRPSPSPSSSRSCSPSRDMGSEGERRKSSATDSMKAKVLVKTGDQDKAGTDANVYIQLEDNNGLKTSSLKLDKPCYDDLERGKLDTYNLLFPEGKVIIFGN